jgi:hypothetical protein
MGTWREGPFIWDSEDTQEKALVMEHHSLYGDSVRGTWKEGSYNEDSETCNTRLQKWSICFYRGSTTRTYRHLAREGMANMFIGAEPVLDIFSCYV